ncbi:MAG: hypothetical protein JO029_11885 [Candidatus Eremiobacteraeota bacterium]|nr:hypothetical protein [Candidatus Eremiobacteraeota bacterium]
MPSRTYARFCVPLIAALTACSGNQSGSSPAIPAASVTTHSSVRPAERIGGVIKTTTFVVGSQPVYVDRDLIVFASKAVKIFGDVTVTGDHTVAFFSPQFFMYNGSTIVESGTIQRGRTIVADVVSACRIFMANGSSWTLAAGKDLYITANYSPNNGTKCVTEVDAGARLMLDTALKGTKSSPNGGSGGNLYVGSGQAEFFTDRISSENGRSYLRAFSPDRFNLYTSVTAGNGADGADDPTGQLVNGQYEFSGGSGGTGGSVELVTTTAAGGSHLTAGNGGNAGTIGANASCSSSSMNGTATAPNALAAQIFMGRGGDGGDMYVRTRKGTRIVATSGSGGSPSLLTNKYANYTFCGGNGFASPAPGALTMGNGGNVTLNIASPGKAGRSYGEHEGANGKFNPIVFGGGEACGACGGAEPISGVAQGQDIQGANGGNLTLVLPPRVTAAELVSTYGLRITLGGFGYGGGSFVTDTPYSYCPSPDPQGFNGGNGGALHDNGLWPLMYPPGSPVTNWGYGFYAGGGASGNPGGNTGNNGYDDEGLQIGQVAPRQNIICNGQT